MVRALNEASLFLSSSRVEGFGLAVAEAMACGCAVVSTDSGGVRDFAIHGITALLTEPGDAEGLASHVCTLARDEEERTRLAGSGMERVASFTWERSVRLLEAEFLDLLRREPR